MSLRNVCRASVVPLALVIAMLVPSGDASAQAKGRCQDSQDTTTTTTQPTDTTTTTSQLTSASPSRQRQATSAANAAAMRQAFSTQQVNQLMAMQLQQVRQQQLAAASLQIRLMQQRRR